ncbi:hypothetical protein C2G38_1562076 [Gigaspora rosea]|uniref:HCP-like protein n=1 Tax=Gigaspora rosea TaxID=44941 RepID=A0A397UZK6_9GLOM|nr:hypothetical protein C2G38_1562076 [Gigaspora rosea]
MLLKNGQLNFEGEEKNAPAFDLIMDLDKGLELHEKKNYEQAWKCFKENADLGNLSAKYWQGYYLSHGYEGVVKEDQMKAMELFKEAADNDHPRGYKTDDAQYRYAFLLLSNLKKDDEEEIKKENCHKIIHYLKLATDNKNADAMYTLGDFYLNGKLRLQKNEKLGLSYLKLAADNGHERAKNLLKMGKN